MQSSGPAGLCGARSKSAGLMLGSGETISMYCALAARLHVVLERCWPGSMLGSGDFVRCRSGLGLDFLSFFFTALAVTIPFLRYTVPSAKRCPLSTRRCRRQLIHAALQVLGAALQVAGTTPYLRYTAPQLICVSSRLVSAALR